MSTRLQWEMEVSERRQSEEWANARHLGVQVEELKSLIGDLATYVDTFEIKALAMDSPVYLRVVLRVERKLKEKSLGLSVRPTTSGQNQRRRRT